MNRFEELLNRQNEFLKTFIEARDGLEEVQSQLIGEQLKSKGIIEAKNLEISEEYEAISFAEKQMKNIAKKIKSLNKIVG